MTVNKADQSAGYVDVRGFPIFYKGSRVAIVNYDILRILIEESKKALGDEAARSLAYHLGVVTGRRFHDLLSNKFCGGGFEEFAEFFSRFMLEHGWGRLSAIDLKGEDLLIEIEDLFECSVQVSSRPTSSFTLGFIEGFMNRLLGVRVVVKEVDCISTGGERCIFKVYPLK